MRMSMLSAAALAAILVPVLAATAAVKAPAFLVLAHTSLVNNAGAGIRPDGGHATILLNNDAVARNAIGSNAADGGQLVSHRNNKLSNNIGPDGVPTGSRSPL